MVFCYYDKNKMDVGLTVVRCPSSKAEN